MKKRAFFVFLSLTIMFSAISAYLTQAAAEQFLSAGAWLTDKDGNLEQQDGYYVYTIKEGDIKDGLVQVRFDPIASPEVLIEDRFHPGTNTEVKVKLVNGTDKKLILQPSDYTFTTVNAYQVGGPIPVTIDQYTGFETVEYGEKRKVQLQYGTAFQSNPNSFPVKGFDNTYIRFNLAPVRTSNMPMARLFGKDDPYDVTLTEAVQAEEKVKGAFTFLDAKGQQRNIPADADRTYADYIKLYYHVDSLEALTDSQKEDVLGGEMEFKSYSADQTEAFQPDTADEKFDQFKLFGIIKPGNHYQLLETDPELLQMGYRYLYGNCMRFTFDNEAAPIDGIAVSAKGMSIADFMEKDPHSAATKSAKTILSGKELVPSGSLAFDHMAFSYQAPNAFNWLPHCVDFNLTLSFKVEDGGSSSSSSSSGGGGHNSSGGGHNPERPSSTPESSSSSSDPGVVPPGGTSGQTGGTVDPTVSTDVAVPVGENEQGAQTGDGGADQSGRTPKTGDYTIPMLCVSASLAVGSGILCLLCRDKKQNKGKYAQK